MKLRLLILLAAAALAAAPASGQTIKSLGYNTTNGQVVYSGTNDLRMPATIRIGTNQSGFGSGGQFLTLTDGAGGVAMIIGTNATTFYDPIAFSSTANASTTRTNLGLGAGDNVTFSNITANGILNAKDSTATPATNAAAAQGIQWSGLGGSQHAAIYGGYPGAAQIALAVGASSNALSDVATFRSTGMTVSSNAVVGGTLAVSNTATFSTNVSIAGSLSVGSFTTTTPSTWALDATQTAAATNGRLTLPSNGNVIRLTNNNAISSVTNGVLGAFYYLVNQATNAVTISNVGGIVIDGAQNLTLSPNESATLVATGATNVSVANRGDLTDVALGGTANTAPSQTASSASSLMTRGLVDKQTLQLSVRPPNTGFFSYFAGGTTAASNGASVSQAFFIRCNTQNATNNVARWRDSSILSVALGFGSSGGIDFSKNLEFGMTALFGSTPSTNATSRVFFGGTNGYISGTTIARHVGWRADASNNVYATHADGTNYTEVLVTNTTQTMKWWHIAANNGFVVWSIDGTQVASATNGPTDSGGTSSGNFINVSETTAASIIYWDIHQIFTRRNP